ncbi:MAG: DUF302 domain-containing protein [Ktedonobacteraceae bacterium]
MALRHWLPQRIFEQVRRRVFQIERVPGFDREKGKMIEHAPEAALYAPLRLAVYENRAGKAFVAYERFTSQLASIQTRRFHL